MALLDLTKKESKVLKILIKKPSTPTILARNLDISRQGVYNILYALENRRLIVKIKKNNKITWTISPKESMVEQMHKIEDTLRDNKKDVKNILYKSSEDVTVYVGKQGLIKLYRKIFSEHSNQELFTLQTKKGDEAWLKSFTVEEVKQISTIASKSKFIHRNILEKGVLEHAFHKFGSDWAKTYIDRTYSVNEIDKKFADYTSQIWVSARALYLFSIEENLAIEIKNKMIIKMIRSLLALIHENSHKIDMNRILRDLIHLESSH